MQVKIADVFVIVQWNFWRLSGYEFTWNLPQE